MQHFSRPLSIALLASSAALIFPAHAVVLDFSGDICSSATDGSGAQVACSNGFRINQAYGDTTGVDVSFAEAASSSDSMFFWLSGYSGLTNVAYGAIGQAPMITLAATAGYLVTLNSFNMGAWISDRATQVTVTDLATNSAVLNSGAITVLNLTPSSFNIGATSAAGFTISFGPEGYYTAIDNISFNVTAIPEPGTWAMLAAGLGLLTGLNRRRRKSATML